MGEPTFDPQAILAVLSHHGVRYALIGGYAAVLLGSTMTTIDADVVPAADRENLTRLASALRELDARLRVDPRTPPVDFPLDEHTFDQARNVTFTTRHGDLDVFLEPAGLERGYEQVRPGIQVLDVDGVEVPVASIDDIITSKAASARPKDLAVLPLLRELREAHTED